MKIRLFLLSLSAITLAVFTALSYTVAKEKWNQFDFDTTVKLQDHISRDFDPLFSYFSLLGSAEVTIGLALILALLSLLRFKFLAVLGWLIIFPATLVEVFGKLVLLHPGTPVFMHRSVIKTHLPSFYIQTDFSYPSGHMTRTVFLTTVFMILIFFKVKNVFLKFLIMAILIGFVAGMCVTRIYLGEHWLSDVVGGSLLGLAAGLFASALIMGFERKIILQES